METYIVTRELKTPWWLKLLRFFHIKSKREEFKIVLENEYFKIGDILFTGLADIKIIGRVKK